MTPRDGLTGSTAAPAEHTIDVDEFPSAAFTIASETAPAGSDYLGGAFLTGPIGAAPSPTSSFTLRFTRPGAYPYICTLHVGMAGTITVDP